DLPRDRRPVPPEPALQRLPPRGADPRGARALPPAGGPVLRQDLQRPDGRDRAPHGPPPPKEPPMTNNPFLDHLDRHYDLEELSPRDLAALAIAHELREANSLTEAINAPSRFVLGTQDPISPEDLGAQ